MRLFVAIYPSDDAIAAWRRFQENAPRWPLRWTLDASLHFTLKFLGQIDDALEPKISAVLKNVAKAASPFSLALNAGGTFPPKGSPSVFWVGTQGDNNTLIELAHRVELECKTLGFAVEKRDYRPHMTVAKPSDRNAKMGRGFTEEFTEWIAGFRSGFFDVNELHLVESRLGPAGSTYLVRASFPFGSRPA